MKGSERAAASSSMFTAIVASWLALSSAQIKVEPDKTTFKAKTVIDFSDVRVNGQIFRPETTLVQARGRTKFQPMVRARADFRPELQKSLDNL